MKKIISAILVLAMTFALAACGSNGGNEEVEAIHLSLGHSNNTDHHYQVMAESFAKMVEEGTDGAVIVDIYPAEQLGSGVEMLEGVIAGTQDMVIGPDAFLANYDPMWNAIGMPYAIKDWDQVRAIPGSDAAKTLEASAEAQGVKVLGWAANGMRVFSATKEINSPADLAGLKIRCGSAELITAMLTALNCQPTNLSMSDVYNGVQTGICDGQENPTANIIGSSLYEVTPYIAVTHHQYVSEPLVMNLAKFESLTEDQQNVILEAAAKAAADDVEAVAAGEEDDFKFLEENGCTITYPDTAEFAKIWEPVTEDFCNKYGDDFRALVESIKAL